MRWIWGRSRTDILAGLTVSATGLFVLLQASGYAMGTARNMGPGYFPTMIGFALIAIGVAIVVIEGRTPSDQRPEFIDLRSILLIMGAISAFTLIVEPFGLAPATFIAVFVASRADGESSFLFSTVLSLIVAVASVAIFTYGLGVQVDAVRW